MTTIAGTFNPETRVTVTIDGEVLSPQASQRVCNHSPSGFAWGYGGSGPAQLALAILLAAGLTPEQALVHHQAFKWGVIATLPEGLPFVIVIDVPAWIAENA